MAVLLAGCTGRGLVPEGGSDDGDDGVASNVSSGATGDPGSDDGDVADSGIFTVTNPASDVDGGDDDGDDGTTGAQIECVPPQAPAIVAEVDASTDLIDEDTDDGLALNELDCEIQLHTVDDAGITLGMDCGFFDEPIPWVTSTIVVTVNAEGITVPEDLVYPERVQVRLNTFRDLEHIDESPWRRTDHIAIYRDGALVLGVGTGGWWPSDAAGDPAPAFWDPFVLESVWTDCDGPAMDCHDLTQSALDITLGEVTARAMPFSLVQIGGYDVHVGEMIGGDSPQCGEPAYGWLSFAIAPMP
jgi:hypothetical protein